ncbi:MAG: glycosyltransferase [Lachnospiraceae bacterium]|nr:glycosyltransferase [Lachnospiraceae bacterium]MDE7435593.1 glycosyltransferase [Lachnospiraceae bacterium]
MRSKRVSIVIPNYNHSRYLDKAIQSALDQTYDNCEIVVLDNASEDDSIRTAMKYCGYKNVRVCRNPFNILNQSYRVLTEQLMTGDFFVLLCADDYLYPDFVEKAMAAMEQYPDAGYVQLEKVFITDQEDRREQEPFYKCSFAAPGRAAMPVYMMTTVAHPSQGFIRRSAFEKIGGYDKRIDHMNADKTLWYYLSYVSDMIYIREESCAVRIGEQTETLLTLRNMQHPILCHLTLKDFIRFAREKNIPEVYDREQEAFQKLAMEFVGYGQMFLEKLDFSLAAFYLQYARILWRDVEKEDVYLLLQEGCKRNCSDCIEEISPKVKRRNYEPPEGYTEIVL